MHLYKRNNSESEPAGYWHGKPLSIGRLCEDVLALIVRMRAQISPILIVLAIGAAVVNFFAPLPTPEAGPITALRDVSHPNMQIPPLQIVWVLCSTICSVALTKVLYSAYHDHEEKYPSQCGGFIRGAVRTICGTLLFLIGACLLFLAAAIFIVVPTAIVFMIVQFLLLSLEVSGHSTFAPWIAALMLYCFFMAITALIGAQYINVAASVSDAKVWTIVKDAFGAVFSPGRFGRLAAIGAIYLSIIVVLMTISHYTAHFSGLLSQRSDTLIVEIILNAFLITPIGSAFGVVFYVDMKNRQDGKRIANLTPTLAEHS